MTWVSFSALTRQLTPVMIIAGDLVSSFVLEGHQACMCYRELHAKYPVKTLIKVKIRY